MRFHADFNPDDLPEEQSGPLLDLLDEMDFDDLPEDMTGSPSMPDQFTYTITVITSQGERPWSWAIPPRRMRCGN